MAGSHPYSPSGPGGIIQVVNQLRKAFPAAVTVDTLKKLGIASGSEAKVLNVLKYVGVLEDDGKKAANVGAIFSQHDDAAFQDGFAALVRKAYGELFDLHGDAAWTLPAPQLISFFRNSDETSALTGQRQASTFQALAGLAGKGDVPQARVSNSAKPKLAVAKPAAKTTDRAGRSPAPPAPTAPSSPAPAGESAVPAAHSHTSARRMPAIHIDVQVHISPDTSPEQIDRIFASMAKHLGTYIG